MHAHRKDTVGRLDGVRVMDLGCGLGVPGCQAAALGAHVTFVDREADALAFAAWNATAQGGNAPIEATELDWSSATVGGRFDLVLLSDVSYHRMHHQALERQLQAAILPHGLALHADPLREAAGEFLAKLAPSFSVACVSLPQVVEGKRMDVRLALICSNAAPSPLLDRCHAALAGFAAVRRRSPRVEMPGGAIPQESAPVTMARSADAPNVGTPSNIGKPRYQVKPR